MMRLIRTLIGMSRREAEASAERDQHRDDHKTAMKAVHMKVAAMKIGVERMEREKFRTEEAAAAMLARLREDFPR